MAPSKRGSHPARSAPAVAPHDLLRSTDAGRSAIGRHIVHKKWLKIWRGRQLANPKPAIGLLSLRRVGKTQGHAVGKWIYDSKSQKLTAAGDFRGFQRQLPGSWRFAGKQACNPPFRWPLLDYRATPVDCGHDDFPVVIERRDAGVPKLDSQLCLVGLATQSRLYDMKLVSHSLHGTGCIFDASCRLLFSHHPRIHQP